MLEITEYLECTLFIYIRVKRISLHPTMFYQFSHILPLGEGMDSSYPPKEFGEVQSQNLSSNEQQEHLIGVIVKINVYIFLSRIRFIWFFIRWRKRVFKARSRGSRGSMFLLLECAFNYISTWIKLLYLEFQRNTNKWDDRFPSKEHLGKLNLQICWHELTQFYELS